jgi:hypothetical protein
MTHMFVVIRYRYSALHLLLRVGFGFFLNDKLSFASKILYRAAVTVERNIGMLNNVICTFFILVRPVNFVV